MKTDHKGYHMVSSTLSDLYLLVPSVYLTNSLSEYPSAVHPSILPSIRLKPHSSCKESILGLPGLSLGLALASNDLAWASLGLDQAFLGLAWATQSLNWASKRQAEASQGFAEASQGLAWDS